MKTYFVTDDGKTFNSKEAAEKYEADINKENDAVKAKRKEILDKVHDTFYAMYNLGFITHEEWKKFTDKTDRWVFDGDKLVDFETGEEIV